MSRATEKRKRNPTAFVGTSVGFEQFKSTQIKPVDAYLDHIDPFQIESRLKQKQYLTILTYIAYLMPVLQHVNDAVKFIIVFHHDPILENVLTPEDYAMIPQFFDDRGFTVATTAAMLIHTRNTDPNAGILYIEGDENVDTQNNDPNS